jgi:hypothetical protein
MPDLNQSDPLVLNYLKQNAIWWIGMQTSTVSESIPITILTLPELHLGQKQSQTSTQISILWAKSGCKPSTNGVLAKDSKIGAIKTTILTYRVLWTLRYSMLLALFSVKMMDPGTRNGESI